MVDQKSDIISVEEKDAADQFNPPLVDNYEQAYQRLVFIERNQLKHSEKKIMYCETVNRYIDDGHAKDDEKQTSLDIYLIMRFS